MLIEMKNKIKEIKINKLRKRGLRIATDCRLVEIPNFGSEPYLISIGNHVTISSQVSFFTHDGGSWIFRENPKYQGVFKFGRIEIKDNCFIGHGVIILPGVTIGPNSVIGAGSVVTKDVPPNTVFAGNPARYVKSVDEYADKSRAENPVYNYDNLITNTKEEILKYIDN